MASRTSRFFARLFDGGVLLAILMPSLLLYNPSTPNSGNSLLTSISTLIFVAYLLFKDGFGGQSIGKRLLRIGVISETSRRPCTLFQSLVRNGSIVLFSIIDLAFILDQSKRRLGDRLAGTVVVLEQNLYQW
jgi:uncharacterized RDD family membrane protein YckC